MQSPWASNRDRMRLGRVQAAAQTFGCQGDKPLRGNRQWIPSCSHARLGRHLLLLREKPGTTALDSLYQGRASVPGAALGEGSLDLAPLGEELEVGGARGCGPLQMVSQEAYPTRPTGWCLGWRVLFWKICLAGASEPANGSPAPAPAPWGHHAAHCCPVGVWTASMDHWRPPLVTGLTAAPPRQLLLVASP